MPDKEERISGLANLYALQKGKMMKSYPFYKCKHGWLIFHADVFGVVYKCYKCGKTKDEGKEK